MKIPPLLLGVTLIFWGWQTGFLAVALVMAIIIEAAHVLDRRWDLSRRDFNRISDLCALIILALMVYRFFGYDGTASKTAMFQWIPMPLYPLMVAQVYSTMGAVTRGAIFWSARRKEKTHDARTLDISYYYWALCLLSASAANVRDHWFYTGLFILSAWSLWPLRSRYYSALVWFVVLLFAGSAGWIGHVGLRNLHQRVDQWYESYIWEKAQEDRDPYKNATSIGDIGQIKMKDHILFRVVVEPGSTLPNLLREASYNLYKSSSWFASKGVFKPRPSGPDLESWFFGPASAGESVIWVSTWLRGDKGMLRLPLGVSRIENLPVDRLQANRYGAVKVLDGPHLINYRLFYGQVSYLDSPPMEADLSVPEELEPALAGVLDGLGLENFRNDDKVSRISGYLMKNYKYSLRLHRPAWGRPPLVDFLQRTKSGHCEYFATATVMLLRQAGIPARYASGYAVHEFSRLEKGFVVRARHAHAWALAWVDGAWRDVDNTPPVWRELESDKAHTWSRPVLDLWGWLWFEFNNWRLSEQKGGYSRIILWGTLAVAVLLVWRLTSRRKSIRRRKNGNNGYRRTIKPASESPYYRIEEQLAGRGLTRDPCQTPSQWVNQVEESGVLPTSTLALGPIIDLHQRLRFHPQGLTEKQMEDLKNSVDQWLTDLERADRGLSSNQDRRTIDQ